MVSAETKPDPPPPTLFSLKSIRLRIALLMMYGMICNLALRTNLGSTIVCMVNSTTAFKQENSTEEKIEGGYDGTLLWDSHLQGLMFSAPTAGSFFVLLPAGYLADKYSPKYTALIGCTLGGLVTYLMPFLANNFVFGFLVVRFLIGVSCGCLIPAFASIASRWFVPNERSTLDAIYTSGVPISGIILNLITPSLCASKNLGGWPTVYYICATATVAWAVLWLFGSANYAESHQSISEEEKAYITEQVVAKRHQNTAFFPWRSAFTSAPFLAILGVRMAHVIQHQVQMFYTTSFIRDVLRSDLDKNGLFATLPYLSDYVTKIVFAVLADYLKSKNITGQTTSVRIFQTVANFGSAFCFALLIIFADSEHVYTCVCLLTLSGVFLSLNSPGANTSALSIAPQHTGTLHGITMLIAFGSASGALYLMGIVLNNKMAAAWTISFCVIIGVNVVSGAFFAIFGSADVQPWARPKKKELETPISTTFSDLSVSNDR